MQRLLASLAVLLAWVAIDARAADTLALGTGTACRMMPERETKAMLGLKKRHVLTCANPDGTVTRVVFTRKGTVDCADTVRVDSAGASTVVGETCSPKSQVAGGGAIVFEGHAFDIHAATTAPVVGNCEGRMTGQVSPDGQSMSGTVSCAGFEFGYTAART